MINMEKLLMFGYTPYISLFVVFLVGVVLKALTGPKYVRQNYLITKAENNAYRFFEKELSSLGCRLFAQVRIADVLSVSGKRNGSWWRAFRQISSKHVDFVVTNANFGILACIELDDASHQRKDRIARDSLVNRAFKQAGLPLIRVKPGREQEGLASLVQTINKGL